MNPSRRQFLATLPAAAAATAALAVPAMAIPTEAAPCVAWDVAQAVPAMLPPAIPEPSGVDADETARWLSALAGHRLDVRGNDGFSAGIDSIANDDLINFGERFPLSDDGDSAPAGLRQTLVNECKRIAEEWAKLAAAIATGHSLDGWVLWWQEPGNRVFGTFYADRDEAEEEAESFRLAEYAAKVLPASAMRPASLLSSEATPEVVATAADWPDARWSAPTIISGDELQRKLDIAGVEAGAGR